MVKLNFGNVKIKTIQVGGHLLDCFGGNLEFGWVLLAVASCLLAC